MIFFNIALLFLLNCIVFSSSYVLKSRIESNRSFKLWNKTPLVANGKRVEADPGSSLMAACLKLGLRVPTDCKKGECGTCTVSVGGNKMRACVAKVPAAPKLKSLLEKGLVVTVDN